MLTVRVIVAVRIQLGELWQDQPWVGQKREKHKRLLEESWSDRATHSLQPLRDTIYSVFVLVVRKRIERILALVILGGISPAGVSGRARRGSEVTS